MNASCDHVSVRRCLTSCSRVPSQGCPSIALANQAYATIQTPSLMNLVASGALISANRTPNTPTTCGYSSLSPTPSAVVSASRPRLRTPWSGDTRSGYHPQHPLVRLLRRLSSLHSLVRGTRLRRRCTHPFLAPPHQEGDGTPTSSNGTLTSSTLIPVAQEPIVRMQHSDVVSPPQQEAMTPTKEPLIPPDVQIAPTEETPPPQEGDIPTEASKTHTPDQMVNQIESTRIRGN